MFSSERKARTSDVLVRALLKVLADGPRAEDIPFRQSEGGVCVYENTPFVRKVQQAYRSLYGEGKRAVSKLPRREVAGTRVRSKGRAAFLRRRNNQAESIPNATALEDDGGSTSLSSLQKTTEKSHDQGTKRKAYCSLLSSLATKAKQKRKVLDALLLGPGNDLEAQEKLRIQRETQDQEALPLERVDLQKAIQHKLFLQHELTAIVLCGGRPSSSQDKILSRLKAKLFLFEASNAKGLLRQLSPKYKYVIWVASTADAETALIQGKAKHNISMTEVVMTRLLGGYLAGPEWMAACFDTDHKLVMPVLSLDPALERSMELVLGDSVTYKSDALLVISLASCANRWTVRAKRSELRKKRSWVVVGDTHKISVAFKNKGVVVTESNFLVHLSKPL
ncbi:unnamed protein product [Symbiodinium sp. CCMP2592]|nr:unnamed protein product [Symbiodinium sp. CCMP2592]